MDIIKDFTTSYMHYKCKSSIFNLNFTKFIIEGEKWLSLVFLEKLLLFS